MRRRARRLVVAAAAFVSGAVACSFELADVVPADGGEGGAPDGAILVDGGPDVVISPPSACAAETCFPLPAGWRITALGERSPCPVGFGASADVVEGPTTTAPPCSCGCQITSPPTCINGKIDFTYDTNGSHSCNQNTLPGFTVKDGGGCESTTIFTVTNQTDVAYVPPQPDGGACNALTVDQSKLTFAVTERSCTADGAGLVVCADGRACAPASAPFGLCIAQDGDVACPAGSAFSVKHLVGSGGTIACAGATCGCNVTAKCSGSLKYFQNGDCTGNTFTAVVDGNCRSEGSGVGSSYTALEYTGTTSNIACNLDGGSPGTPVTSLTGATTLCCRP